MKSVGSLEGRSVAQLVRLNPDKSNGQDQVADWLEICIERERALAREHDHEQAAAAG